MDLLESALIVASLLCSLVAGFLFAFATVTMPGIRRLRDREFIRAFQVMDGVIQNNQPVFMLVWIGSVVALVTTAVVGVAQLAGAERLLVVVAVLAYLLGVQLPTLVINIPLNNKLQTLDVETMTDPAIEVARRDFEARWNSSNSIRAAFASLVSALLLLLLLRL